MAWAGFGKNIRIRCRDGLSESLLDSFTYMVCVGRVLLDEYEKKGVSIVLRVSGTRRHAKRYSHRREASLGGDRRNVTRRKLAPLVNVDQD
jgi:hypothetical protein